MTKEINQPSFYSIKLKHMEIMIMNEKHLTIL